MANGKERQEAARAALKVDAAEKKAKGALPPVPAAPLKPSPYNYSPIGIPDEMRAADEGDTGGQPPEADYAPQPGITPGPDPESDYFNRSRPFSDTGLSNMSTEQLLGGRGRLALTMAAAGSGIDPIDATQEKANKALLDRIDHELSLRGQAF